MSIMGRLEAEEAGKTEAPVCDLCHMAPGVRFTDLFWTCATCRVRYLMHLEREPGHGSGRLAYD